LSFNETKGECLETASLREKRNIEHPHGKTSSKQRHRNNPDNPNGQDCWRAVVLS